MADTPEMKPDELAERVVRLEAQMGEMQKELGALAEALRVWAADAEVEAVAADRIRSGAAQRTVDGAETLAELGFSAD